MSTPPEPGQSLRRPVLEPTYVVRRRRTEALAELVREFRENERRPPEPVHEPIVVHVAPATAGDVTEELPPVPDAPGHRARAGWVRRERPADDGLTMRRALIIIAVTAAGLIGFGAALVLPGPGDDGASRDAAAPPPRVPATSAPVQQRTTDPDGPGTLREGDSGAEVTELQERLLRIPDVYEQGSTDGRYDATLAAAVARFQLWYGIRGDETGVYGNDTRRDLESRTTL
ncbi:peptidoglycan-binding domain-containing protein [Streptomyces yaanensis]|uniref:Peptidoglycan-binding domain-containing protein n=1 Tax=Streptomyces yaanensis TaxID=1142239 RepID=A0ABV7S658_9ACTN|nr:peptidoglycan-binding domain-containing protein [Streptomyces sp. CGMCC 4.7035]WNB99840.1 peptidoglycan-binding domain-containing protein [Streptomyces sp. CGMCC 4.7035]